MSQKDLRKQTCMTMRNGSHYSSFLEKKCVFENKYKIKSISLCSSFFLCLQGQPELCGIYHLLQSSFSFIVLLHGQPEQFSRSIILQFCCSIFFSLHGQPVLFASDIPSLQLIFISSLQSLRVARRCFSWSSVSDDLFFSSCSFLVLLLALSYSHLILSLSLLCSSVALFALSFSFLSDRFFFGFFFDFFFDMLKLL